MNYVSTAAEIIIVSTVKILRNLWMVRGNGNLEAVSGLLHLITILSLIVIC